MNRVAKLSIVVIGAAALAGCTSAPAESPQPTLDEFQAAASAYPQPLPDGFVYPDDLTDPALAGQWWWCSTIDAAWRNYFEDNDEPEALRLLSQADANMVDFVDYSFGADGHTQEVRYIDGGVDSAWLEGVDRQCTSWASAIGADQKLAPTT